MFAVSDIRKFWPNGDPAWVSAFVLDHDALGARYGVNSLERWRQFLAQVSAETDGLRCDGRGGACMPGMVENLNYRPASLLAANGYRVRKAARDIARFRSMSLNDVAAALCADHDLLAETVYGGRADLGNTTPGDGALYIGRGPIQNTGREIYAAIANATGIDCLNRPELLEQPRNGWEAAFFEWHRLGCNALADGGDVEKVSRRVNGGTNGLAARRAWLRKAKTLFPGRDAASEDHNAVETASLDDLRDAGSRSAGHIMILQKGAVVTATVTGTIEAVNQVGDQIQAANDAVAKITSNVPSGVGTKIITTAATATHGLAKGAHYYVGIGTFVLAVLVAIVAVLAGKYLVDAYRTGRYIPRSMG